MLGFPQKLISHSHSGKCALWTSEQILNDKSALEVPGWLSWLNIQLLISAQVMISLFVGSNPMLSSVLTAQGLLGILSLSLSLHTSPAKKTNKQTNKKPHKTQNTKKL